jgi:hypothetical protein
MKKYTELNEAQKSQAIEKNRDWNTGDSYWNECTIEDAKEIGKLLGIDMENIFFSGFSSQGDGACFTGSFAYAKGMLKEIKSYAPLDTRLHAIARDMQELHRKNFYRSYGTISHRGHYYHERSMLVDVETQEDEWLEVFADLALWIYRQLEKEYDYQSSDEAIAESIIANEMEFEIDEEGDIAA